QALPRWRQDGEGALGCEKERRRAWSAWVPGAQHDLDFMLKDRKRFAESGGWGYAELEYDAASKIFKPGTGTGNTPQANDAKCGYACHTGAQKRDYVFTEYGTR